VGFSILLKGRQMKYRLGPALAISASLMLPVGLLAPAATAETGTQAKTPAAGSQTQPTKKAAPQTQPAKKAAPQTQSTKKPAPQTHSTKKPKSPARPAAKASASAPLSFTDEDLKRYGGTSGSTGTRPAGTSPADSDPLKTYRDRDERARWRREKAAALDKQVKDLEERLKFLERKRLSIANPLVGRPAEPGESEARDDDAGLTGPELLAKTDAEIQQTSQDLEKARKTLADFLAANPE
jgi:hypothetical protein